MIVTAQPHELTTDEKNDVIRLFAHLSIADVAAKMGCHKLTIEQVLRETLWGIGRLNQDLMQRLAEQETLDAQIKEATV